jgi:hypothetical protein
MTIFTLKQMMDEREEAHAAAKRAFDEKLADEAVRAFDLTPEERAAYLSAIQITMPDGSPISVRRIGMGAVARMQ